MNFPELAILGVLVILLLIAVGLLSSRSLTEHLVSRGVLPHLFLELIPVIVLGARLAAVAMILIGLARFLAVSGLLSSEWVGRYGLASLLVVLGIALLGFTFRERRRP
jgi:prolipoprotein diacylglyceryltransferase